MTRTILATATALVAAVTLSTSAANACISCEYTPEVVRSSSTLPHTGHYYSAKPYAANKDHGAAPAKRRVVKSEPVAKKFDTAKAKTKATESTEVAKAEPTETTKAVDSESSSISLASNDVAAIEKAPVAKPAKEAAAKPTDCKKFFASVGMTLTVPCE